MFLRSAPLAVPLVLLAALGVISCSALKFSRDKQVGALDAAYVARTKTPYPAGRVEQGQDPHVLRFREISVFQACVFRLGSCGPAKNLGNPRHLEPISA